MDGKKANDAILTPYPRPPARKAAVEITEMIPQPMKARGYQHRGPDTRGPAVPPPPNGTPSTWPSSAKDTFGE
jgi:hypothetical protein